MGWPVSAGDTAHHAPVPLPGQQRVESRCNNAQAGPPYELDPRTLRTAGSGPALLGGLLIDGVAPSSTNSYILDKVPRFFCVPRRDCLTGSMWEALQSASSQGRLLSEPKKRPGGL